MTNSSVNLLGHLSITHQTVSASEKLNLIMRIQTEKLMSINNTNRLSITNVGVDAYADLSHSGSFGPSSDFNLKENIKEMDTNKCLEALKYVNLKLSITKTTIK